MKFSLLAAVAGEAKVEKRVVETGEDAMGGLYALRKGDQDSLLSRRRADSIGLS